MPLIPALRRQRQVNLCEFEVSLVYRVSSRTAKAVTEKPSLEKQKMRAGEMAQRLRASPALTKVLSSIPSNHMVTPNHL